MWPSPMAQSAFLLCTDYLMLLFLSLAQLAGYQASDPPEKDSNPLDAMKKAEGKLSQPTSPKYPDTVKDPRAMAASGRERGGDVPAPRSATSAPSETTNMESSEDKCVVFLLLFFG